MSNIPTETNSSFMDSLIEFYGKYTARELAINQKRMQLFNGLRIFESGPIADKIIEALKIQDKNGVVHAKNRNYSSFQSEINARDEMREEERFSGRLS